MSLSTRRRRRAPSNSTSSPVPGRPLRTTDFGNGSNEKLSPLRRGLFGASGIARVPGMKRFVLAFFCSAAASTAAAAPIALDPANDAFERQIATRFPAGAGFAAAKADLEADG